MTARRDPDSLIDAFLQEGADQLHDQVYDAVRSSIEHRRQRAVIGPWRMPTLNKIVPATVGAVAVVAVLLVGAQLLRSSTPATVGGGPIATLTALPTAAPTAVPTAAPTTTPTSAPAPSAPALTQTYTSRMNGFSMSYPAGWVARAATEPWTDRPGAAQYADPGVDVLQDPNPDSNLFLYISSRAVGKSTPGAWIAGHVAASEGCTPTESITVDGASGVFSNTCALVFVTTAARGYRIALYTPTAGEHAALDVAPYDRSWFEAVLATVRFHPEDAVDAPASATP